MLSLALDLAAKGFAVFPCAGKAPAIEGGRGFRDATRDPAQIRAWWSAYPDADVGVWPARCEPPLLVVDIDVKDGAPGMESALELAECLPPTLEAVTPSGGSHLYYTLPPGAAIGNRALAPGIDLRSENGYVVWYGANSHALAAAPPALVKRCTEAQERAGNATEWLVEPDLPANVARFTTWLRAEVAAGRVAVAGQGANNLTYATAEVARDFALSEETCLAVLWREWNPHCLPRAKVDPHHLEQLEAIIAHAYRYAKRPAGNRVSIETGLEVMKARLAELERAGALPRADGHPGGTGLRFLTLDELGNLPRPAALVKQILYSRSLVLMIGAWGRYKSFLALDLAAHLALGRDWAGHKVREAHDVLYVAAEGETGISKRLAAWQQAHDARPDRIRVLAEAPQFMDGGAGELDAALDAYARDGFRPSVIFIDTLASVSAGADENGAKEMSAIMEAGRRLIRKHGVALVFIHHTGKDANRGARGWSGLEGAADGILFVDAAPETKAATVEVRKAKDSDSQVPALGFRGDLVELGRDEDGDAITSLAFRFDPSASISGCVDNPIKLELRRRAFMDLVPGPDRDAVGSAALAEAIAAELTPGEDEEGQARKDEVKRVRKWLNQMASRGSGPADVRACLVPGITPAQWRKPST